MFTTQEIREYLQSSQAMRAQARRWKPIPPPIPTHEFTEEERRRFLQGKTKWWETSTKRRRQS